MPMRSRPAKTAGSPWIWIGVGFLMPFDLSALSTGSGKRISLNDLIGGGTSSPSTRMCHLSRTACRSSSDIARMCDGGRHPVAIESLYSTPLASSLTDMSGLYELSMEERMLVSSTTFSSSLESGTTAPLASAAARSSSSERFLLACAAVWSVGR
eukprot:5092238-Pleurochrysis_carterae.AAC.1